MEDWISFIGNYGFPIVITFYLLIRFESKIDKLTDAITKLTEGLAWRKEM